MCGLSSGPFRHFQHTSRRHYIYEMGSISGRRRLLGVAGNWADDMTPRCKLRVERCQSLNLWLLLFEQDLRLHTPLNGAVRHCARDWNSAKSTSCWSSAVTGPPRNEPFPSLPPFLCSYANAILKRSLISSAVPVNNTIAGHPFSMPERQHHAFAYLYLDLCGASLCPPPCLCYGYVYRLTDCPAFSLFMLSISARVC